MNNGLTIGLLAAGLIISAAWSVVIAMAYRREKRLRERCEEVISTHSLIRMLQALAGTGESHVAQFPMGMGLTSRAPVPIFPENHFPNLPPQILQAMGLAPAPSATSSLEKAALLNARAKMAAAAPVLDAASPVISLSTKLGLARDEALALQELLNLRVDGYQELLSTLIGDGTIDRLIQLGASAGMTPWDMAEGIVEVLQEMAPADKPEHPPTRGKNVRDGLGIDPRFLNSEAVRNRLRKMGLL